MEQFSNRRPFMERPQIRSQISNFIRRLSPRKLIVRLALLFLAIVSFSGYVAAQSIPIGPNLNDFNTITATYPTSDLPGYLVSVPSGPVLTSSLDYPPTLPNFNANSFIFDKTGNKSVGINATLATPVIYHGFIFKNNTVSPVTCVRIKFTIRQISDLNPFFGPAEVQRADINVSTAPISNLLGNGWLPEPKLDMASIRADNVCTGTRNLINGTAGGNFRQMDVILSLPNGGIQPGGFLNIRWSDIYNNICESPFLTIDDLQVDAYSVPLLSPPVLSVNNCSSIKASWPPHIDAKDGFSYDLVLTNGNNVIRTVSVPNNQTYFDFTNLEPGETYKVQIRLTPPQSPVGCGPGPLSAYSSDIITPKPEPGTAIITPTVPSCGMGTFNLNLTGYAGATQWEEQVDCQNQFTPISGANSNTYSTGNLTSSKCFRAKVSMSNCNLVVYSNVVKAEIIPYPANPPSSITVSPSNSICAGQSVTLSIPSQEAGTEVIWQKGDANCTPASFADVPNVIGLVLNTSQLTTSECYRYLLKRGNCVNSNPSGSVGILVTAYNAGTVSGNPDAVCISGTTTLTLSGQTPGANVIQWEKKENDCSGGIITIPQISNTINESINTTTCFRARLVKDGCSKETNWFRVQVENTSIIPGTISGTTSTCSNAPVNLTISGSSPNDAELRWEKGAAVNNSCTAASFAFTGVTGPNYNTNQLVSDYCYRVAVRKGVCTDLSSTFLVRANDFTPTANITPPAMCGAGTVNLSLSMNPPASPDFVQWYRQVGCFGNPVLFGGNVSNLTDNISGTTCFYAVVTQGGCTKQSNVVQGVISENAQAGPVLATRRTVCYGNHQDTLTLSSYRGDIQWLSGVSCGSLTEISGQTSPTLAIQNLTQTTCYVVRTRAAGCPDAMSAPVTITVAAGVNVPSVTTTPFCANSSSAIFSISNVQQGAVYNWTNLPNGVTILSGQGTRTLTIAPNSLPAGSYTARVEASISGCPTSQSTDFNFVVSEATNAGAIFSVVPQSVCQGSNTPVVITLSGQVGNVIYWESSVDNFGSVSRINSTTPIITITNLTQNTSYRAVVQNGNCELRKSQPIVVYVTSAPNAGSIVPLSQNVCAGGQALFNISNPPNGQIIRWESSTDNFVNITTINNNQFFLYISNALNSAKYRAVVSIPGSGCSDAVTQIPAELVVDPASIGGSAGPNASVCSGSNTATISLSGQVGNVQFWESSNDNFLTSTRISSTQSSITVNNLTESIKYRAFVKNANCVSVASSPAEITVLSGGQSGVLVGAQTVCNGNNNGTLVLQGGLGTVLHWEALVDNITVTISNTNSSYNYTNLTQSTRIRVVSQNANCGTVTSNYVAITVLEQSAGGIASASSSEICSGNSTTVTLSQNVGSIQFWQKSENNCDGPWTTLNFNTTSINTGVLLNSACFRASVASNNCGNVNSLPALITVKNLVISNIIKHDASCRGANNGSIEIVASGVPQIEYSIDGGANYSANEIFENLMPRTYIVLARERNGSCVTTPQVIQITQPVSVFAISDVIQENASCNGGTLGSIDISISGATGTPTYVWSGGQNTEDIQGLIPGVYSVTVTDEGGCTQTGTYTITGGTPVNISGTVSNSDCNGANNGSIIVSVSGGGGQKTFSWSDGTNVQNRSSLAPGRYSVTVTDVDGCSDSEIFDVNDGASISLTFTNVVDVPCQNVLTGSMQVNALGGVAPYTYSWSDNANGQNTQTITNIGAGEYIVTVMDANGCSKIGSKTINTTSGVSEVSASASSSNICIGSSVTLTATSIPSTGVTYSWFTTPAGGTAFSIAKTAIVTPSNIGENKYYVEAFLNSSPSCVTARIPVVVTAANRAQSATISGSSPICSGQTTTLTLGNFAGTVIRWEASNNNFGTITTISSTLTSITTPVLTSDTRFRVITGGCEELTSNSFLVEITPSFEAGQISGSSSVCSGDNSTTLNLVGSTGALVRWEASRDNFVTSTTISNPSTQLVVTNLTATTAFRAIIRSGSNPNCDTKVSGSATVTVRNNCGEILVTENTINFGDVNTSCTIPTRSYAVSGTRLTESILITAPINALISLSENAGFTSSIMLPQIQGNVIQTTIFVKFSNSVSAGAYNSSISHTSGQVDPRGVVLTGNITSSGVASLTTSVSRVAFGQVLVGNVAKKSYRVVASNLNTSVISVSINSPFGLSLTQNGIYSQSLNIPVSNCNVDIEVFVSVNLANTGSVESPLLHRAVIETDIMATAEGVNEITEADVVTGSFNSQEDLDNAFGPGKYTLGVNAFNSLQAAVNGTPEDKVLKLVGPTHYSSNTVIDKPITIVGDGQATIIPLTGVSNTYPGEDPNAALNSNFSAKHGIIIKSDDVKIKNIKLDGGSNIPCESRFGVGIISDNRSGQAYTGIEIDNVEVKNVYSRGIQLYNVGSGNRISNVTVDDVCMRFHSNPLIAAEAAGIYINKPSDVTDNTVTNAGTGIIADNLGAGTTNISNNEIQFVIEDGIRVDTRTNMISEVQVRSNRVSNVGDAGIEAKGLGANGVIGGNDSNDGNQILINSRNSNDPGIGIRLSGSSGAQITNNTVIASGMESGIHMLANSDLNNMVSVNANTINRIGEIPTTEPSMGQAAGIFMSDNGAFSGSSSNIPSYARFFGNEVTGFYINFFTNGNGIDGNVRAEILANETFGSNTFSNSHEGVRVNGKSKVRINNNARSIINSDIGVRVYGGDVEIIGNSFHNNIIAVKVEDKPGFIGTAVVTDNLFYDNQLNLVNASNGVNNVVDASWNWWGTTEVTQVRPLIQGLVDYSPFFNSDQDIDNNLGNGFRGNRTFPYVDALSAKTDGRGQIQEAIDEPLTQKIQVVDGVYDETTKVNRSITLTNDGIGLNPVVVNLNMENASATLSLEQSFDITGTLALNGGKINVSNGKILSVLRGGTTTTGTENSYVIGQFARQSANMSATELYFPIGTTTAFRPAALTISQGMSALNTYIGQVIQPNNLFRSTPSTINTVSNVRLHNFRKSGSASIISANVRMAFGSDEPMNPSIVKDADGTGSMWYDLGGLTTADMVSSTTGFTTLGNFALATKIDNGGNNGNNGGNNNGGGNTVAASEIIEISNITTSSAFVKYSVPTCQQGQIPRYELRYRLTGEANWTTISNLNNNFYFLVALQPATRYEIGVRSACGSMAFSEWSTTVLNNFTTLSSGTCDGAIAPVPGGLYVNNTTGKSAMLNWNLTTNGMPQGTIIGYGPVSAPANLWAQVVVCHPANSHLLTGLQPNTIYGVRIRTNCSNCTTALNSNDKRSNWTNVITFNTGFYRDLNSGGNNSENIAIYPNPNKGNFTVNFDAAEGENVSMELVDINGRVVFDRNVTSTGNTNAIDVNLNGFLGGVYVLKMNIGGSVSATKVIIE